MTDDAVELKAGDRIRVTFETTVVDRGIHGALIRPTGPGRAGYYIDDIPGITYEVIAPEIKPLDLIEARWIDSLPLGSIVLCADTDTEFPWMKMKNSMNSERVWVRMWCVDTFIRPYPSSHYRVLRVGGGFEK